MSEPEVRVGIEAGEGLVARFGDVLLLVAGSSQNDPDSQELIRLVESSASGPGPSGTAVAGGVAGFVAAGEPGKVPSFGLAAPLGDAYVVLLHGSVWAEIATPAGTERISGHQAVTWVDRRVELPFDWLSLSSGEPPVSADPRSDLRAGLVPGGGLVMTPAMPEVAEGASVPTTATSQADADAAPVADETAAEPAAAAPILEETRSEPVPTPTEPVRASRETVDLAPVPEPIRPVREPARETVVAAPLLGYLVHGDGMRIPLDRAYVLGREPDSDPAVTAGRATPVRLNDQDTLLSRVQTYIAVDSGRVLIRDASSANGTFVAAPGAEEWMQVGTDPVEMPVTWSLRVGKQVFTFVSGVAES